jgi:7-carboxy-7-deazaguanine synthase (Cx14CxxC type)
MSYQVKEIFYTLQGEGANTGRAAVFCRFAGCNLWSGREEDRAKAICQFCDTDFVGIDGLNGGRFASANELVRRVAMLWPMSNITPHSKPLVICTGGEPLLQVDEALVKEFHTTGFDIAIETNGTILPPQGVDWVCVSPKAGAELVLKTGDEIKLVFPQCGAEPTLYEHLSFRNFFLQPMDGPDRDRNIELAVQYCLRHPQWRLSLQTHKFIGLP